MTASIRAGDSRSAAAAARTMSAKRSRVAGGAGARALSAAEPAMRRTSTPAAASARSLRWISPGMSSIWKMAGVRWACAATASTAPANATARLRDDAAQA